LQLQHQGTQTDTSIWIDYGLFAIIALTWSSSFLFIKIAVADIPPLTITAGRILIAAVILYAFLRISGGTVPKDTSNWMKFAFIGFFGNLLPFFLISYGEQSIDSGLAAILMGVMPVSTIVLAHLLIPEEPFSIRKGAGVALGFSGVLVLVGVDALAGFGESTLAQLAVLGGAVCYSITTVFVRRTVSLSGPEMAAGSQLAGAAMVIPLVLWVDHPWTLTPATSSLISVLILGVFSTAIATLIYFRLVKNLGAGRLSQVNYLIPVFGAAWGIMFLGERLQTTTFIALAMVLAGIAIASRRPGSTSRVGT
jgi:drug/metabolite transporter (DMT)-like permease